MAETNRIKNNDRYSLDGEIDLLRVHVDRISELINESKITENQLKVLNTLSLMTQSISTMIRTHYLTRGKGGTVEKTIMEALEEIRIEMGI